MEITAIILTGGQSRRMGTDKALLHFKGQTLLDRAINICSQACNEIIISSDVAAHERNGCIRVEDEMKNCGPMGGIYSCLKQSSNEWNFVLSVDAPFVNPEIVHFLTENKAGFDAVVPTHGNKKEPLIALYHQSTLSAIKFMLDDKNYRMQSLFSQLTTHFVKVDFLLEKFPKIFDNLNTPEDIDRLNQ